MWYRLARNEYAKYSLFENYQEVGESIVDFLKSALDNNLSDDETIQRLNTRHLNLSSPQLGLNIPVIARLNGTPASPMSYSDDGVIYLNVEDINKFKFDFRTKLIPMLAHEIQHAVEHLMKPDVWISQRETKKHQMWVNSAEDTARQEGDDPSNFYSWTTYYNMPSEVRARLVEIIQHYNLPTDKEHMKETIGNDYTSLSNLAQQGLLNPKSWIYMSKEAKNYIVSELYKQIFN